MTQNYCLENFSFLDIVSINMRLGENETTERYSTLLAKEKEVFAGRMMKYLGAFYNARILILSPGLMEVLSQAPDLLNCQRLRFCNLRRIDVEMWFTRSSLHSLAYLFEISPIISHLFLTSNKTRITEVGDNWEVGLSLPCTMTHLKFVEMKEVEGSDNELKFVSFLLKRGIALEIVDLCFCPYFGSADNQRKLLQFKKKLGALPRASNCLTFLDVFSIAIIEDAGVDSAHRFFFLNCICLPQLFLIGLIGIFVSVRDTFLARISVDSVLCLMCNSGRETTQTLACGMPFC
ncbi:uncharacterized protein LOC113359597 [Papaver somniferum]|uniref:uncharacterized protein LOC113359597 n=1 Tax=Papaver somniferum TaxID=3469 RepID=UPI000E6FB7CB|nr:uncharacterized protein LOC113359597 [Papaver somniferum]